MLYMRSLLFVVAAIAGLSPRDAHSQTWWWPVHQFNIPMEVNFLSDSVGFVSQADGSSRVQSNPQRTTDGGKTWQKLPYFIPGHGYFEMSFASLRQGYAAGLDGLYKSVDTGATWQRIDNSGIWYSVYAVPRSESASGARIFCVKQGALCMSDDDGAHWTISPFAAMTVTGNRDSVVIVAGTHLLHPWSNIATDTCLLRSTNLGVTWDTVVLDGTAMYSLYCVPHTHYLFRATMSSPYTLDYFNFLVSSDLGWTWDNSLKAEAGKDVRGTACAIYVCTADPNSQNAGSPPNGVYRTTDLGKTWTYNTAMDWTEIDDDDYPRLSVVGGGAILYGMDEEGELRLNPGGGVPFGGGSSPGSLSEQQLNNVQVQCQVTSGGAIPGTPCDSTVIMLSAAGTCNYFHVDDLQSSGLLAGDIVATQAGQWWNESLPSLARIALSPTPTGKRSLRIHSSMSNDDFKHIDTTIAFSLTLGSNYAGILRDTKDTLDLGTQSVCSAQWVTGSVSFRAVGCSDVAISRVSFEPMGSGADFEFAGSGPGVLNASSSQQVYPIRFLPTKSGVQSGRIVIVSDAGNDTVFVTGSATAGTDFNVYLKADQLTDASPTSGTNSQHTGRDTIEIPLYAGTSAPQTVNLSGIQNIHATFGINANILDPVTFVPSSAGASVTDFHVAKRSSSTSLDSALVTISIAPGTQFSMESEIGKLRCAVFVVDSMRTEVTLISSSVDAAKSGCLTQSVGTSRVGVTLVRCGDSTLASFMQNILPLRISSISPNPSASTVNVSVENGTCQESFELLDAVGKVWIRGVQAGPQQLLDISSLPSGMYYLRLRSNTGATIGRRLAVCH